jgi:hypothetical protein
MKRFLTLALLGAVVLGASSVAYANVCALDVVPAATLLFPFVPYDYDGGMTGQTTLFTITNVSSEAQIVHITVWSDYSVAILDFNVILTGYDVVQMNIRDILGDGTLPGPLTGDTVWDDENAGEEPVPLGPVSPSNELWATAPTGLDIDAPEATWDGTPVGPPGEYLDCDPDWADGGWLSSPNNYTAKIDDTSLTNFENAFRLSQDADKSYYLCGETTDVEDTWFITRDGGPAWTYITADVVQNCNKDLPDNDGISYFGPATVTYNNVIIGDVIHMNADMNFSEADNAIHLEADINIDTTDTPLASQTTFYHRYTLDRTDPFPAWTQEAEDGREPLPTAWAFRYQYMPAVGIDTWVRAWKGGTLFTTVQDLTTVTNSPSPGEIEASSCLAYTYYSWDMDENPAEGGAGSGPGDPWSGGSPPAPEPVPNLLPLETQEVGIDNFKIVGTDDEAWGWMLFVWPRSNIVTDPEGNPVDHFQTWMGVKYSGFTTDPDTMPGYTASLSGAVIGNFNCFTNQVLPDLGLGMYTFNPPITE